MNLISDKILLPWQLLLIAGGMVLIFSILPWLIRDLHQLQSRPSPSWISRVGAIFSLVLAGFVLVPSVFFLIVTPFILWQSSNGNFFGAVFFFLFLTIILFVLFWNIIGSWSLSIKKLWLPFLLALGIGFLFDACALKTLGRVRDLSKRSADASNLRQIGTALHLYHNDYGFYPTNLGGLVDGNFAQPEILISPHSKNAGTKLPSTRPYQGPIDFNYIPLPENAPTDLIWIWESPDLFANEGGYVLYFSDEMKWLEKEKLEEEVARTHAWLAKATASAPAEQKKQEKP